MVRYGGLGTWADLNNHANQLNPNNWRYWNVRENNIVDNIDGRQCCCCCRLVCRFLFSCCWAVIGKPFLGLLALLFTACAVGAWFLSGYVIVSYKLYEKWLLSNLTWLAPLALTVVGILFLVVAILSCCTVCQEGPSCYHCLLATFLLLLFSLLVAGGVLAAKHKQEVESYFINRTLTSLSRYTGDNESDWDSAINIVQQELHCCGENNYTDWLFTPWAINQSQTHLVPWSCCDKKGGCGGDIDIITHQDWVYQMGCFEKIMEFISHNFSFISLTVVFVCIFLVIGMVSTCKTCCQAEHFV